ncbi:6392_t:CDS:2, partial [Gigaspora margarita]
DAKRLKEIQLTEDEWNLMRDLVNILGPFYETTEELGCSKYITISYIFPSILALMQKLSSSICYSVEELNEVDFKTNDLAFDENIGFHKVKNALYNALLYYWDLSDAEAALRTKYNNAKSLYQSLTTSSNKSFSTNKDQDRREECQIYQKSFLKTAKVEVSDLCKVSDKNSNYRSEQLEGSSKRLHILCKALGDITNIIGKDKVNA